MKLPAQAIVERDERMDRIERHLEVLIGNSGAHAVAALPDKIKART